MSKVFLATLGLLAAMGSLALDSAKLQEEMPSPEVSSRQKAEQLWEQAIEAKGGRERLHAVRSLLVSSRTDYRAGLFKRRQTHFEMLYVFPNKFWWWLDQRGTVFGLGMSVYNGESHEAWNIFSGGDPFHASDLSGWQTEDYQLIRDQLLYLMETQWVRPVPLKVTSDRVENKLVDVVHTIVDKRGVDKRHKVYFYLDQQTHLPIVVDIYAIKPDGTEEIRDYVGLTEYTEVSGIQMPGIVTYLKTKGAKTTYQMNVEYDPQIFERPPSTEAGPEAWRGAASE